MFSACASLAFAQGQPSAPLTDTGQIGCYNNTEPTGTVSAETPSPVDPGFEGQDCEHGHSADDAKGQMFKLGASTTMGRDYTKIANDGRALPASAELGTGAGDWACTRDNLTGLVWEIKTGAAESDLRHQGHRYAWYDTDGTVNGGNEGHIGDFFPQDDTCNDTLTYCNTSAYVEAVNAIPATAGIPAGLCGHADWRMPTWKELLSLVDYSLDASPRIDPDYFPNTAADSYWSGDTMRYDAVYAPIVRFQAVGTVVGSWKWEHYAIRLVRSGP